MIDYAAVERICLAATAHNYGQTVYEITDASGILRVRMSSWPRAKEATEALTKAGYAAAQDGNEVMVLTAPAIDVDNLPTSILINLYTVAVDEVVTEMHKAMQDRAENIRRTGSRRAASTRPQADDPRDSTNTPGGDA